VAFKNNKANAFSTHGLVWQHAAQFTHIAVTSGMLGWNHLSQPCSEKMGIFANAWRTTTFVACLMAAFSAIASIEMQTSIPTTICKVLILPLVLVVFMITSKMRACATWVQQRECGHLDDVFAFIGTENVKEDLLALVSDYLEAKPVLPLMSTLVANLCHSSVQLSHLRLCRQQLDDSAASLLAKSLIDNTAITHVDLACNNIGDDGAVALANGIGTASQLIYLDVAWNRVGPQGAVAFAQAVESRTADKLELVLSGNNIGCSGVLAFRSASKSGRLHALKLGITHDGSNSEENIFELLNSRLKVLSLASNKLDGREINQVLRSMSSLVELELQNNLIGKAGLKHIVRVLDFLPSLEQLDLSHNDLGEEAIDAVAEIFTKNTQLRNLNLAGCCLGRKACQGIASAIMKNSQLRLSLLNLASNNLCNHGLSYDGIIDLAASLRSTSSIRQLILERNQIRTAGCWPLASMLRSFSCTLLMLDLSSNEISSTGAITIAKALQQNSILLALSLRSNMVDASSASAFGGALEVNTSLLALDLENNDIDETGFEALSSALCKNQTLRLMNLIMNEFDPDEARQQLQKHRSGKGFCDQRGEYEEIHAEVLLNNCERVNWSKFLRGLHVRV